MSQSNKSPAFLYRALSSSCPEIRLLTSLTIDAEDRVTCRLITVPLDECPPYVALSYVWGDAANLNSIQIDGQDFQATRNLSCALRYLPRHWKSQYPSRAVGELCVWADAICIHQQNLNEKNHQLQLMGRIYSRAELVMCWLPDGIKQSQDPKTFNNKVQDDLLSTAFQTFELIDKELGKSEQEMGCMILALDSTDARLVNWLARCPELIKAKPKSHWPWWRNEKWQAMHHCLGVQYWQRVWIFQELFLSREALLFCKSRCMPLAIFYRPLVWFKRIELSNLLPPREASSELWYSIATGRALGNSSVLVHIVPWMQRRFGMHLNSWLAFACASILAATNPKDHVYGALGITGINIAVDYSEQTSVAQVFQDVTVAWLQDYVAKKGNDDPATRAAVEGLEELWFLAYAGLRRECDVHDYCQHFPSWVMNLSHLCAGGSERANLACDDADYGVFSNDECRRRPVIRGSSLLVTGVVIDTVQETYPQMAMATDVFGFVTSLFTNSSSEFSEIKLRRRLLRDLFELSCREVFPDSMIKGRLCQEDPFCLEYLAAACAFVRIVLSGGAHSRAALETLGFRTDSGSGFLLSLRKTFLDTETPTEGKTEKVENTKMQITDDDDDKCDQGSDHDSNQTALSWLQELLDSGISGKTVEGSKITLWYQRMVFHIDKDVLTRSVIFRTSRGYIGLVTKTSIAPGDLVCVLKGFSSTVALRENGDQFYHLGMVRLQDMMGGEVIQLRQQGLAKAREFELR